MIVHGDDFCALADELVLDEMEALLKSRYELKRIGTLGPGPEHDREIVFLNRIARVIVEDGKIAAFEVEADPRHVEIIVQELGLTGGKSVDSPQVKAKDGKAEGSPLLSNTETRLYRSLTMRAAYLAADRADVADCVKNLARKMQEPRVFDMARLKRLARYLRGKPRVVQRYAPYKGHQDIVVCTKPMSKSDLDMYVDSDNAGDRETRRSTVGQVAFLGGHVIKHLCNLLQVIGLSSGENEYYAICAGACTGLGLQSLLADWGIHVSVRVCSDASAARAFASRRGLGKMKHVQTRFLWTQERLAAGHLKLACVKSPENHSDLLTKVLPWKEILKHMLAMGQEFREGRSENAKLVLVSSLEWVDPH